LLDTGLENPLLADPDLNLGDFNSPSVNGIDLSGITDGKPPPVVEGDDGNLYLSNAYYTPSGWKTDPDFSEPVYYYTQSSELGDVYDWRFDVTEDGRVDQQGSYFTRDQIKEFWEADQGMGYFQQQNPNLDFDTYMAFVSESSDLQRQGFTNAANGAEYDALADKYGIQTTYQNDDGDVFQFNGSNYTKTSKVDDSFDAGGLIMSIALSAMTAGAGGYLANLLGPALGISPGVAKTLITSAVQIAKDGEVSLSTAFSLAGANVLPGGTEMITASEIAQDAIDSVVGIILDPNSYKNKDNGTVEVVWNPSGGSDGSDGIVVNVPDYSADPDDESGGDSADGGADSEGGTEGGSDGGSDSDATDDTDSTTDDLGGNDDLDGGDIVGRQIDEAIRREQDPEVRGRLIDEWEKYTGRVWDESVKYPDAAPTPEPEITGYVWDAIEGVWSPVYGDYDPATSGDGVYQQGNEPPTGPPENSGGSFVNGVWVPTTTPTNTTTDTTATTPAKAGDACDLGNNQTGVLNENLECVKPTRPSDSTGGSDSDGDDGDDDDGDDDSDGGDDGDNTGGEQGTAKEGDACTLSDGSAGEIGSDGQCKKKSSTTVTVNVGPTTFSVGPSTWGNTGGGGGKGDDDGDGDGGGEDDGGNQVNFPSGEVGTKGSYTPSWSPLFATNQFRKFNKNRGNNKAMAALQQNANLSAPKADFSQSRLNLFSDLIKDLK
jgi:hypothetical protein